jgi:hypothetical protein
MHGRGGDRKLSEEGGGLWLLCLFLYAFQTIKIQQQQSGLKIVKSTVDV